MQSSLCLLHNCRRLDHTACGSQILLPTMCDADVTASYRPTVYVCVCLLVRLHVKTLALLHLASTLSCPIFFWFLHLVLPPPHLTIILSLSRVGEPSASRPLVTKRSSSPSAASFSNVSGSKSSLQAAPGRRSQHTKC
eukprot:GHRQ01035817.1.p1 GENE.GHRQ01035817.1~~GHRQ01035817.1.p1  ORF type:complete len:138 (+),score=4.56 GHRQ01035817.1:531-944(+)